MKCTWLIDVVGDGPNQSPRNRSLRLRLNRFETECGWDHLYVFDGDSMFGQMIAAYSGLLVPEGGGEKVTDLVAHSGEFGEGSAQRSSVGIAPTIVSRIAEQQPLSIVPRTYH